MILEVIEIVATYIFLVSFALLLLILFSRLFFNPLAGSVPDWYWRKIDEELMNPNSEIPEKALLEARRHRR